MPKSRPADPLALVKILVSDDYYRGITASEELDRLLEADADMTAAAAFVVEHLHTNSGKQLGTMLAVVNRHPPADWPARIDALFAQLKNAKKAGDRRQAAYLLCKIGGADRWAAPMHNLHVPDLWPRLWAFADSGDKKVAEEVRDGVEFGLRACPNRALAERFIIEKKLPHLAVNWAWMGEDVRALMERVFDAGLVSRKLASDFTIVHALQCDEPHAAIELFRRIEDSLKMSAAYELALSGKLIQPVAAVVEWIGGLLTLDHTTTRYKAAQAACERAERKQDIGPILPHLGRVLDTTPKTTGEHKWALWWSASALGVTPTYLPQHRDAALAELTARLTGKAVARHTAGYGLAIAHMMARDLEAVRELFAHADDKVCAGALVGFSGSPQHMHLPGNMHDFRALVKPLLPPLRKLRGDPRKAVAAAATSVVEWL